MSCVGAWTFMPLGGEAGGFTLLDCADVEATFFERRPVSWRAHRRGNAVERTTERPKRTSEKLHRRIMGLGLGEPREVDHINRDPLDNRRCNLRVVTRAQNSQNLSAQVKSSGHRGVCWSEERGKWRAYGQLAGKHYALGHFDTEQEAAAAASAWRAEHMPYAEEATR